MWLGVYFAYKIQFHNFHLFHYPFITYIFLRPKGDVEVDVQIEASLAREASLNYSTRHYRTISQ